MRKYTAIALLFLTGAVVAAVASGCEDTDVTPPAQSEAVTEYVPEGCEHTVRVAADVLEAGLDDGVVGFAAPDHVHVSWAGPSASSFTVNWRADRDTTATQMIYGTDEAAVTAADGAEGGASLAVGHHVLYGGVLDAEPTRVHEVHVCGLSPSTTYFYKVGGPGAWSAVYDYATAPPVGSTEALTFAVTGDSRNNYDIWAEVQKMVAGHGVDFQLFGGDAVGFGTNQVEWNEFFEATSGDFTLQDTIARSAFMVVNGNHENLSVNFIAQFAMPQEQTDGEAATGKEWYAFDYGNVHVVALNDYPEASGVGEPQRSWLENDLANVDRDKTPWVFAVHHRSTYSCGGSHGSDLELRAAWQPIFDAHEVDIVFSGHDHLYERTLPVRAGEVAASDADGVPVAGSGTIYVVSAGAGADLYGADDSCVETFLTESTQNYVIVDVEDRTLRLNAYRLNGTVLDSFVYTK